MATLKVEVTDAAPGGPVIVTIKGEAVVELELLVSTLQRVSSAKPPRVVLDLEHLSFISSLAMGVMLAFRRAVQAEGGRVRIAAMQRLVLDSFKRARLDKVFEIFETLEGALAA